MRVALYARVSTDRQQERGTIASQLQALHAAADAWGDRVAAEFSDDGHSGTRLDRPALDSLRDGAQAGVFERVLCLCADRLARSYVHQVLILEELKHFDVDVRFLEGPAPGEDPQANLLIQMQGVIAEYEHAKIAERMRRGRLYRVRQGEICWPKVSYGYRRIPRAENAPARLEVFEPEAQIVRFIFQAFTEQGRTVRGIACELYERAIPSPEGKPTWGTSTLNRLLRNEAYIGTVHYNRIERTTTSAPGGRVRIRDRERPRAQWIDVEVPAIVDSDTFERARQASVAHTKFNPRGAQPGVWLLRGLVRCGRCGRRAESHKISGRDGSLYHYYRCPKHETMVAGGREKRCQQRAIRARALDDFVFERVRSALLDPRQLTAGEDAVINGQPVGEDELVATQLRRLKAAKQNLERERNRLLDAYQAELIDLAELTRRSATIASRGQQLTHEHETLTQRSTELAGQNRLRRGLAGFARTVGASIEALDFDARQRLIRLVVEDVIVHGTRVEIHLTIPLNDDQDKPPHDPDEPPTPPKPSSGKDLRSLRLAHRAHPPTNRATHRQAPQQHPHANPDAGQRRDPAGGTGHPATDRVKALRSLAVFNRKRCPAKLTLNS